MKLKNSQWCLLFIFIVIIGELANDDIYKSLDYINLLGAFFICKAIEE